MNNHILASVVNQPWFIVVMLVAFFGLIVLAVILVKKFVPAFKNQEKPKSDREVAAEEVARLVVEADEEGDKKESEPKEGKPSEEEALNDAVSRATEEIDDPEVQKQMDEWAKKHKDGE